MADQDILIGPGRLYRAPLGEADPDESTVAWGAAWGGNWVDMGDFIEGSGIALSIDETFADVYTEQSTAAANSTRTRRTVLIKCTLAEHTVANMAVLLQGTADTTPAAGGGQKGFSEIPFGDESEVNFYKWGIEALRKDDNDDPQPARWFLNKGRIRLAGDLPYAKTNPTGIPIEIMIFGVKSLSAAERLGKLQIVTAAATAT